MLDTVRISQKGKDQLATLKRRTGIPTWNILSRWAFTLSLSDPSPPRVHIPSGTYPIEMTWRTFGGEYEEIYYGLLVQRCIEDGIELTPENIAKQFRLHLHRGLSALAGDRSMKDIESLVNQVA